MKKKNLIRFRKLVKKICYTEKPNSHEKIRITFQGKLYNYIIDVSMEKI